jgi:hypothetical protein
MVSTYNNKYSVETLIDTQGGHKMSKLLKKLKKLFHTPTAIESFIASKNPTNTAEVEFWLRHYDQNKFRGLV